MDKKDKVDNTHQIEEYSKNTEKYKVEECKNTTDSGVNAVNNTGEFIAFSEPTTMQMEKAKFEKGIGFARQITTRVGGYEVKFGDGRIEMIEAEAAFEVASKLKQQGNCELLYIRARKI